MEGTVAVSSLSKPHCHLQSHQLATKFSSTFVETEVYQELLERLQNMVDDMNNIQIFGPKGTGKTYVLLRLKESLPDTCYIDLEESSETVNVDNTVLIDNAQLFTSDIQCGAIRSKTVIAAFSPGAKLTVGRKVLSKRCGDGRDIHFCWRPFMYSVVH